MSFTPGQTLILSILNVSAGAMSVVGATFVIICHSAFGFSKKPGIRLVLYVAICDFAAGVGHLFFNLSNGPACLTQGFLLGLFEPLSFYWTLAIAVTLFLVVVR
eukprot:EC720313.1.p1 GENE.EC720313.1~~EC720313.1.p1  ORF type:complete len:104 (+),score=2.08 EC720313.1:123-434(+)